MWQAGTTIHHHTWPGSDRQEVEEREDGNLELRASAPPFQTDNASSELVFLFPRSSSLFSHGKQNNHFVMKQEYWRSQTLDECQW